MLSGCAYKANYIIIILSCFFLDYSVIQYICCSITVYTQHMYSKQYWSKIQKCHSRSFQQMASMHKFAINIWSQARVFQKTWLIKIFLDLHSIDSYKKVSTCTSTLFMNYTCSTKRKLTAATGLLGSHQKRQKEREIKFIIKHVEIAMTQLTSCSAVLGRTKCD